MGALKSNTYSAKADKNAELLVFKNTLVESCGNLSVVVTGFRQVSVCRNALIQKHKLRSRNIVKRGLLFEMNIHVDSMRVNVWFCGELGSCWRDAGSQQHAEDARDKPSELRRQRHFRRYKFHRQPDRDAETHRQIGP